MIDSQGFITEEIRVYDFDLARLCLGIGTSGEMPVEADPTLQNRIQNHKLAGLVAWCYRKIYNKEIQ